MKQLEWLDKGIQKMIEKFSYDFYAVNIDQQIDCVCKDFTTKQGSASCKLCLGTGQKIKIRKIKGASQESSSSFRSQGNDEKSLATIYYVSAKYQLDEMDLIVDSDNIFIVHRMEKKKGTSRDYVFKRCSCINKKTDVQVFLKNFNEIVKR
jgi:hypothetical protein